MKTIDKYNIRIETLMRIFHELKRNPKKIFVAKDFFKASPKLYADRYLETLIKLGLVEKLNVIYRTGWRMCTESTAI